MSVAKIRARPDLLVGTDGAEVDDLIRIIVPDRSGGNGRADSWLSVNAAGQGIVFIDTAVDTVLHFNPPADRA